MCGGNSDRVRDQLTHGVRHVVGNTRAFAAVKEDGSVITWGDARDGRNSNNVKSELSHVVKTLAASAVVNRDGSVVAWGH